MKKMKLFAYILALATLTIVGSVYAQHPGGGHPGGFSGGGGGHPGGDFGGRPGGYDGDGHYGGFNHGGYAVAPYHGVATGPIGYVGFGVNMGGPGYGYGAGYGYRNHCNWDYYWHQWRCW
jgi:hypothetical protein